MRGNRVTIDADHRYERPLSVIGHVSTAPAGNVVLRVGRCEHPYDNGWHQTEHVVLSPEEARDLAYDLLERANADPA